jgi:glutamine synthetase
VEATGLVWESGDADKLCHPVPGSLQIAPWLDRTGQVLLSMYELDGVPAAADPRHCLQRAVAGVESLGYTPVFACEVEFYLLQQQTDGSYLPAGSEMPRRPGDPDRIDAYSLARLDSLAPLFREVFDAAAAQGLSAGTLMSEYAPGQFEITLQHRADALAAVDEAILFKRLLKGVAAKRGLIASFMAKPFTHRAGSGAHLHLSLQQNGANAFASDDPQGTVLLRQVIGGLKATAAESFLAFAPNGNSYRRFQRESYAPTGVSWGVNNRSVSLRIPAGPPASRHVEHRFSGADVNLYVAAAAVLAGAAQGIEQRSDPGSPVVGNGYAKAESIPATEALPATWHDAVARADQSAFLSRALGPEFLKVYLAIKRQELAAFSAEVTDTDRSWYLQRS